MRDLTTWSCTRGTVPATVRKALGPAADARRSHYPGLCFLPVMLWVHSRVTAISLQRASDA